jgi:hypothetical protein
MSLNGARSIRHTVRVTQPRGADAPRSWLYMRLCIAKVVISPAHVRACKQERRASARRGVRKHICKGDTANMRETAAGVPANVVAIAVAGGASVVFRVTGRWYCECASANHRGLTPPALGCTRVCASQKSSFCRHRFAHSNRSGGREPAVGGGNAFARAITETYRKLRPLGLANLIAIAVAGEASVVFRVTGRWHCECASANHGGLTPPLLCRTNARLLGIFDFRCTRVTQPREADAPRSWLYTRLCIAKVVISPAHVRACKQERRA